ncbi:MAG: DUF1622 domain-containing protein [Oscillospiraceae bacterium]|jgi:uncharacterized membrane protein|nr:DUF1622 domain-containing protein [Oscillospiraceae bacterium]
MAIKEFTDFILPYIISAAEFVGIFVVTVSAVQAFWHYLKNTFLHGRHPIKFELANGLATGLEFKMAAEILKTVLIHEMSELLVLGAIIILRALLSFLIHFEIKNNHEEESHNA